MISDAEFDRLNEERVELIRKEVHGQRYSKKRLAEINRQMDEYFKLAHDAAMEQIETMLKDVDRMVKENNEMMKKLRLKVKKK